MEYDESVEQLSTEQVVEQAYSMGLSCFYFVWTNNIMQSSLSWMTEWVVGFFKTNRDAEKRFL